MRSALLLVGHGSHLNAESSAPIHAHAKVIRERGLFDEVRTAFWKEEPSLSRALDGCSADDVTVVPVFMSAGYFTNEVIPREMGLNGRVTCVRGRKVRYTAPVGSHPALATVIVQRALEAGATPRDALAVLGHGTERNRNSQANIYQQTETVRRLGRFAEVLTVFMDQEPAMNELFALTSVPNVVVVPVFIADGWHAAQTIPGELGGLGGDGRRLRYAAAVGTHPSIAEVILELAAEAAAW
ncbi:MAG: CbiX/SirB N-terminal domain-containing protein [Anaerolineaceae bacterium]